MTAPADVQDELLALEMTLARHLREVRYARRFGVDPAQLVFLAMALTDAASMTDDICARLDTRLADPAVSGAWEEARRLVGHCAGCAADLDPLSRRQFFCSDSCSLFALVARRAIEAKLSAEHAGHSVSLEEAMDVAMRSVATYEAYLDVGELQIVTSVIERIRHLPPERICDDPIRWPAVKGALEVLASRWRQDERGRAGPYAAQ